MEILSKINIILFLFRKRLDVVGIMIFVCKHVFILLDVVKHMSKSHLSLCTLFMELLLVRKMTLLVELLLNCGKQLEAIF